MRLCSNVFVNFLLGNLFTFLSLAKIHKRIDYLLISQAIHYPWLTILFAKLSRKRIIDFIGGSRQKLLKLLIPHADYLHKFSLSLACLGLRLSLLTAWKIVLISPNLVKDDPFDHFKDKITIAHNFPSREFYSKFKITRRFERRQMTIGYVGSFIETKGVFDLARAIPLILIRHNALKVLLIGDVDNSIPKSLGQEIRNYLAPYQTNVKFLGYVSNNDLPKYLNKMRLLILPSYTEGFPHVILEAMACGVTVLAAPIGGIPELLGNGQYGFILRVKSPQEIADCTSRILEDDGLAELSNQAREYIRRNYTYRSAVRMWSDVLGIYPYDSGANS